MNLEPYSISPARNPRFQNPNALATLHNLKPLNHQTPKPPNPKLSPSLGSFCCILVSQTPTGPNTPKPTKHLEQQQEKPTHTQKQTKQSNSQPKKPTAYPNQKSKPKQKTTHTHTHASTHTLNSKPALTQRGLAPRGGDLSETPGTELSHPLLLLRVYALTTWTCQARVSMRGRVTHVAWEAPAFTSQGQDQQTQHSDSLEGAARAGCLPTKEVSHLHGWIYFNVRPHSFTGQNPHKT